MTDHIKALLMSRKTLQTEEESRVDTIVEIRALFVEH